MTTPAIVLATSGLGRSLGGIGVVAEMMRDAICESANVRIVRHHHEQRTAVRIPSFGLNLAWAGTKRPSLIVYDHVDLARFSLVVPTIRHVPYAIFIHGTEMWRELSRARRMAIERAALVLANSEATVRTTRSHHPWFPPTTVCRLGVQAPAPSPTSTRTPKALIVGRMDSGERYKGHDAILDAWPVVTREVPEAALEIIGWGDDEARLRRRAADEGLANVTFLGRVSDDRLEQAYRECRLFLFPSRFEGFGLAAAEAGVRGCAVLGLAGTVLEEVFGRSLVRVNGQTGQAIADAAIPVLRDSGVANELGRAAKDAVEADFLAEHFHSRFRAAIAGWLAPPRQ